LADQPPDYVVTFPTLWVAPDWIERHCVVPDGFDRGNPFEMVEWQLWALVNFYRLKPEARVGQLAPAFHWRRAQLVMPQKAGKAPYSSAHILLELIGPSLFNGWSDGTDVYRCRDWGCGCGWVYRYRKGEAMGRPRPTPLIQVTAFSSDQTDNIWDALKPMIQLGPLDGVLPHVGEDSIRSADGGEVVTVTSNALSRLGQRVTFVASDETGIWFKQHGMHKVAETQARGASGMGGRVEETTNAWNPREDSTAQRTAESKLDDIFRLHPQAPASLKYSVKAERRKIHRIVYRGCPWIDLDSIEGEALALMEHNPTDAERFFGNRAEAGGDTAFDAERWAELANPTYRPDPKAWVVGGCDGARFHDAVSIVATEVQTGFTWNVGTWERPEGAGDDYEHPADEILGAAAELFETYAVGRFYCDPQWIDHLVDQWIADYGEKRVIRWYTNRRKATAYAVRGFKSAMTAGDLTNDGDPRFAAHIGNAKMKHINDMDDDGKRLWVLSKDTPNSPRKIDAAMAAVLSWEARGDAIADGPPPPPRSKTVVGLA
jgi:hypothetical protein